MFVFECSDELDENTISGLIRAWKISGRIKVLNTFYSDLKSFIRLSGLSGEEIFNMLGYAGTVFSADFLRTEPPLPDKYLPADYPLKKIYDYIVYKNNESAVKTKKYFMEVNG